MPSKKEEMLTFWTDRACEFKADPRANTNDIWLREIEISFVDDLLKEFSPRQVLDFGCANGFTTMNLAASNRKTQFEGIDINSEMIAISKSRLDEYKELNLEFRAIDILKDAFNKPYDFIYAIRAFQNVESAELQKKIFDRLFDAIEPNGIFLYIESYKDGYKRLNEDRTKMGLPDLPIHQHLTLLTDDFDKYVAKKMTLIETKYISSSYYLITRLLYSYLAKIENEEIDYNHPIHQVAAMVPQVGDYGPLKASVFRKL